IAGYAVVAGIGVRASGDPLASLSWLMILQGPWFLAAALLLRRGRLAARLRPVWRVGALGGLLSMAAYGLVLWAQTMGSLAAVAALRETSIIFGAIIAALVFKEGLGRLRVVSAAVVALRETCLLSGAIIAALVFKEGLGRLRVVSAAVVAVGIALLNL